MIDWDTLLHLPMMKVFGEQSRVPYTSLGGWSGTVDGIFDEGAHAVRVVVDPEVNEVRPLLGIRLSQFPYSYDPRNAKGDSFIVKGRTYIVKDGKPDGHGWAQLEATLA